MLNCELLIARGGKGGDRGREGSDRQREGERERMAERDWRRKTQREKQTDRQTEWKTYTYLFSLTNANNFRGGRGTCTRDGVFRICAIVILGNQPTSFFRLHGYMLTNDHVGH